jgi:hypothetical protein
MAKLSPTQAKVVKAKVEAELADVPQAVAAQKVFPRQTPAAASVSMSRELKKANVQEALQLALEKHNLTPDRIMGVVSDGMSATKVTIVRDPMGGEDSAFAEETPDHSIRLKAAGMAAGFMGLNRDKTPTVNINFNQHAQEQKEKYGL